MKLNRTFFALAAIATYGASYADPIVDGSYDAEYGAALSIQDTQTQFGDANIGLVDYANGSELDGLFVKRTATHLYILATGNLESNYNKLELFFDSKAGGQNRLDGVQPDTDFGALVRMAGTGQGDGLKFDTGFNADYWFSCTGGGDGLYTFYANYGEIGTTNGQWLGQGSATVGTLSNSNDLGCEATINNSNFMGVDGGTGLSSGAGVTTGVEWKIPLNLLGNPVGAIKLCVFVNGSGHDYLSNQVLGPIGGGSNYGDPRYVDFDLVPGNQYVEIPGTGPTISGVVTFSDSTFTGASATFEIRDATNTNVLSTQTVSVDPSGNYVLAAPGNGNYYVSLKFSHWLRRSVPVDTTGGNATNANLVLTNGDVNGDNEIGIGDYALLSLAFNSFEGDPNYNAEADLNGDGEVGIGDYAVLSSNYGQFGDD